MRNKQEELDVLAQNQRHIILGITKTCLEVFCDMYLKELLSCPKLFAPLPKYTVH